MSDTPVQIVGTLADLCDGESIRDLVTRSVAHPEGDGADAVERAYRAAIDRRLAPNGLALDDRDRLVALRPLPGDLDVNALVRAALGAADLAGIARAHGNDANRPDASLNPTGQ